MRVAGLPLVLQAVLLSIVFPAAGDSAEMGRTAFHRHRHHAHVSETERTMFRGQSLEAKIHFCSECHGRLGQGYGGYYTIPQLAGQQLPYSRTSSRRSTNVSGMIPLSRRSCGPICAISIRGFGRALPSTSAPFPQRHTLEVPENLVAEGKKLFEEGVPDANIPACVACHGDKAQGSDVVPRLAGQLYAVHGR